jgi:hypothetical protein
MWCLRVAHSYLRLFSGALGPPIHVVCNYSDLILRSFEWSLFFSMDDMNNLLKTETRINVGIDSFTLKYALHSIDEG